MFEVKVTPDTGKRFTVTVERDDLGAMLGELSKRMNWGQVVFVTVKPIAEKVEG